MPVTLGSSGITFSNGTTQTTAANGTVSSVTVSAGSGLSGGGTVTTSGTITLSNAGVTSVSAGTGISVSASTGGVTITNTASTPTGYGDVGTYVVAYVYADAGSSYNVAAGATIAGSSLYYNSSSNVASGFNGNVVNGSPNTNLLVFTNTGSAYPQNLGLSGTWRYMTRILSASAYNGYYLTLFLRIS